jgi:hypothetical protein
MSGAENFLIQARMCYSEWGSQMRVESIDQQLVLIKRSIRDAFSQMEEERKTTVQDLMNSFKFV